ncbi:MAG: SBBP repeat-containing protein [Ignavibacteria bacterium]|nr:SBBP repeat-containing protein [Ignavibacteria bacterium]
MTKDNLSNIIVCTEKIVTNGSDFLIIKYNSFGEQMWLRTYNSPFNNEDSPSGIVTDDSNNIYVIGISLKVGIDFDFVTIKYNPLGEIQWVSRYSGTGNGYDTPYSIGIDSHHNVFVTGQTLTDTTTYGNDMVLVKYNTNGIQQWVRTYHGTNYRGWDCSNSLFIDKSDKIYITGFGSDTITGGSFVTIKFDQAGNRQWVARFNGPLFGVHNSKFVQVDDSGNVYVSGTVAGPMYYDDYGTVKYNSSGIQQWSRTYAGSANFIDQIWGMAIDNIGNVYVTGYSTEIGTGYDYTTIKYNSTGEQIWLRRYNYGLNDNPMDMKIDNFGNVYITGQSVGNGTNYDFATVKYDSSGNQKWVTRYNYGNQSDDESRVIVVDNNGSIYVTGLSNENCVTIKYTQTLTGVYANPFETPSEFKLEQNYPNPFNPNTIISFSILENVKSEMSTSQGGSNVKLIIYSSLGNEVATLVNERKNAGSYEVEFNGSNFSSGIYFYSLTVDGNLIDTKKMILLK